MEAILKLSRRGGGLAKWVAEVRTYDISYIPRNEAGGSVIKKFLCQGKQVERTSNANEFNASNHARDCETLLAGLAASANQGLATIRLEFLNQEVSLGIKTRPSIEETSNSKKGKATSNAPGVKPNYNHGASGSN
ncbi:hypothetical protein Tco_0378304 [Tanacetum coccineum]